MSARANSFAVMVTALAIGAACNNGPRPEDTTTSAPEAAMDRAGDAVSDTRITATIQSKYFGSSEVKGHEIDVDTDRGVVTLKGKVDNEQQREQAAQIARGVDGVSRVENQLVIMTDADRTADNRPGMPDSRSPGWITAKIQSQYYLHPGLKPWNIDVDTSNAGVVTLSGEIDNAADRAEAVKIASSTDGVARVEDQLHAKGAVAATSGSVEQTAERAGAAAGDAWITTKIGSRYFVDGDVRGRNIDVDTSNGVVTLKGTVGSHSERIQAVAIARNTDGVKEVRDQLSIAPDSNDTKRAIQTTGQTIDDAWITTKLQSKYFASSDIKARKVDVDTKSGVVTLNGAVPTPAARDMAVNLARETDGVKRVVNNLKVDSSLK